MATSIIKCQSKVSDISIYGFGDIDFPVTFNVPSGSRHLLIMNGPFSARGRCVILANANNSGVVQAIFIGGDSDAMTIATSANTLTVSINSGTSTNSNMFAFTSKGNRLTIAS